MIHYNRNTTHSRITSLTRVKPLTPLQKEETDLQVDIKGLTVPPEEHVHLTQYELHGLKAIVMYLHALPTSKKCVPELITDPIALIRDVRTVVEQHRYDKPELARTCKPVLEWWTRVSCALFLRDYRGYLIFSPLGCIFISVQFIINLT